MTENLWFLRKKDMPRFVLQGWGYGTLGKKLWFGVQVFRQFQVVLEYHILSTILYTIEPNHIMALVKNWCQNPDIDSRLSRIRLTKPRWRVQELLTQQGLSTISWPKCLILIWLLCVTYCYCNYICDCGSSWIICFWHHYWKHTPE